MRRQTSLNLMQTNHILAQAKKLLEKAQDKIPVPRMSDTGILDRKEQDILDKLWVKLGDAINEVDDAQDDLELINEHRKIKGGAIR